MIYLRLNRSETMPPIGDNKIVGSMDIARIPAKILAEPVRSKTYKEIAKRKIELPKIEMI